jgi:acetolactate synthase small subunit
MRHVFRLTLKDQTGRTVRVYEVLAERGIQAVFSIPVLCETAFVLANGGKAVLKERKY